ncbi:MAG TPA: prepilin-type N-terminal cleavage/methylation domain-containing protein [Candidatus Saccharimonadales bacterium]|nr:prepilin-type N-terminal cleavage/methylation domain-containing protein [Candidatus Saccharimonadales bacterium]
MKNNQNGFSAFELIIVVLVIAIIGVAGYWVYNKDHTATPGTPQTVANTSSPAKATDVSSAPAINTPSDLTKAEQILDQNDPSTANNSDSTQLDSQLSAF